MATGTQLFHVRGEFFSQFWNSPRLEDYCKENHINGHLQDYCEKRSFLSSATMLSDGR